MKAHAKEDILESYIEEIDYCFSRLSREYFPGHHPSVVSGSGFVVKGYENIFNHPDFTNIDWTATLLSGSKIPLVKIVEQKSAINVLALADLSASMGFKGSVRKLKEMAKFVASIGFSAYKIGDRFGLIAYGDGIEAYYKPMISRGYSLEIGKRLWDFKPQAKSSRGIIQAVDYLPKRPCLVFWLSDFNMPFELAERFLKGCSGANDIIPIIFWDTSEFENLPNWGMAYLKDPETGERRLEFFTPSRKKQIERVFESRRLEIKNLMKDFQAEPIWVLDEFRPLEIAEFFLRRRAV